MKPYYQKLCTEFYDITKPEAGPKEVAFYEKLIKSAKGPVLEAMCGSGRLLIPLLKKGLVLEGVDNSSSMLESCQKRCAENNLPAQLYNQSLQALHLPKKYDLIFIAIGSFQLIHDRDQALQILKNLSTSLLPSGRLVLETFIPSDASSKELLHEKTVESPDGSRIVHRCLVTYDFTDQLEHSKSTYEKWAGSTLMTTEEEEYRVRWYNSFELQLLLEKAGFSKVRILDESFEQNEQAIIYVATLTS